jgi:hypothetical protein
MSIEDSKQSEFSPGPVSYDETLLRIVFSPDHIDINGNLKPEAIPTQDLKERGFSVQRKSYVRKKKIHENIEQFVSRKDSRNCKGISPVECKVVRSIEDDQALNAFDVIDDALTEEDRAHAKIMFKGKHGPSKMKALRRKLMDEFRVILEVKDVVENLPAEKLKNRFFAWIKEKF